MRTKILLIVLAVFLIVLLFPGSALGWQLGAPTPPWAMGAAEGMRVERTADPDAYHLVIHLRGLQPEAVNVSIEADRWLLIGTERSDENRFEVREPYGYGYHRNYSFSSANQTRRYSLPRDADASAMQREDLEQQIKIRIPRHRS